MRPAVAELVRVNIAQAGELSPVADHPVDCRAGRVALSRDPEVLELGVLLLPAHPQVAVEACGRGRGVRAHPGLVPLAHDLSAVALPVDVIHLEAGELT